jgi:hypothetical protein
MCIGTRKRALIDLFVGSMYFSMHFFLGVSVALVSLVLLGAK